MTQVRNQALDTIGRNALALGLAPAMGADGGASAGGDAPSVRDRGDGPDSFEIALNPIEKRLVMAGLRASGADKGVDRTIGALTNGSFAPQEIKELESRVLDGAKPDDVSALYGLPEGTPVYLNRRQKMVIERLMGQLGDDPLARRAREAYGKAVEGGNVRVR